MSIAKSSGGDELQDVNKPKTCFIITPLGDENSDTRRKADGLIASVIRPVLSELSYKCLPPHEIDTSGSITIQIVREILEAPMVIANLTDLNPNVMYELAIRHAKRLPVISLVERGTRLPFDLAAERTLFYDNDMMGVDDLKPRLKKAIETAEKDTNPDNPIYRAIKEATILQEINSEGGENVVNGFIIDRLDELSKKISNVSAAFMDRPTFNAKNAAQQRRTDEKPVTYKTNIILKHTIQAKNTTGQLISDLMTLKLDIILKNCYVSPISNNGGCVIGFNPRVGLSTIMDAINELEELGWRSTSA